MKQLTVIGAGLAGAACAHAFASAGWRIRILEASPTPERCTGASSVPLALFAPRVSADDAPYSRLLRRGAQSLLLSLQQLMQAGLLVEGEDWALSGLQQHAPLGVHPRAMPRLPAVWHDPLDPPHLQSHGAEVRGARVLVHPFSGWVKPRRLVRAWLSHPNITVQYGVRANPCQVMEAVICAGHETAALVNAALDALQSAAPRIALQPVRGQVQWGRWDTQNQHLCMQFPSTPMNGLGHWVQTTPRAGGHWLCGATHQRDEVDLAPRDKDTALNFAKLAHLTQASDAAIQALAHDHQTWVGVRATTQNRYPLVMQPDPVLAPSLWICAGLGSRGLSLARLCAQNLLEWRSLTAMAAACLCA